MTKTKICTKCKLELDIEKFGITKQHKSGRLPRCISCCNKYKDEWVERNKERILQYRKDYKLQNREKINKDLKERYLREKEIYNTKSKEYREKNKEKLSKQKKDYYLNNKELFSKQYKNRYKLNSEKIKKATKDYYYKNKERIREVSKLYRQKNREKINAYNLKKKKINPIFKLKYTVRNRILTFLKMRGKKKIYKFSEYIGCTVEQLKTHLQTQFREGMNWENHGKVWHIDHIIPLCSASTDEEIYKLCHYSNLQPLFAEENWRKSGKHQAS